MASPRDVLGSLASRSYEPEPEPVLRAPLGGGGTGAASALPLPPPLVVASKSGTVPLPMVVSQQAFRAASSPSASAQLSQLLEESKAARSSLATVLSPRMSPKVRPTTQSAPPAFDLGGASSDETGAIVAAAAGALKRVEQEPDARGPGRPRQASMPITPVSEEYAEGGSMAAGGDAVFAPSPPKRASVPNTLREVEPLSLSTDCVEPECVAPVLRPRLAGSKRRPAVRWSARREAEVETDADQELAVLREERA